MSVLVGKSENFSGFSGIVDESLSISMVKQLESVPVAWSIADSCDEERREIDKESLMLLES